MAVWPKAFVAFSSDASSWDGGSSDPQSLESVVQESRAVRGSHMAPRDKSVGANQHRGVSPHAVYRLKSSRHVFEIARRLHAVPHDAKRTSGGTATHAVGPAIPIRS